MRRTLTARLSRALLAMGVVAVAFAAASCKGGEAPAAETAPEARSVDVLIEVVAPGPMRDVLTLPGESVAVESVTVSAEYGGRVEWMGVVEGDRVEADQEIAKVDLTILTAQLGQAQANYDLTSDLAARRRELRAQGMVSQEDLDQAERDFIVARSQLEEARLYYRQGLVTAPISGVINQLFVDSGEFIDRGKPVAEIVNSERIRIKVSVPEMDVRWLRQGQPSLVTVDAYPEAQWVGEVTFVSVQAESVTKTFEVWVELDNGDGRIRPGMMTRAYFEQQLIPDALSAPLFAVVDRGGERILFVEENGVVRAVQPEFGVIEGDRVQVVSGLEIGDHLIVAGQTEVEEGVGVTVR